MIKRLITLLVALTATTYSFAGPGMFSNSCPKFYVGPSLGINKQSGLVGAAFDIPVTGQFSLGTGAGLSSWGYKAFFEGRFYFRDCNRGWALGAGASYNTGIKNFTAELPTNYGDDDVTIDLEPVPAIFFSGYYFFSMGERHRFYLQSGWSQRLVSDPYVIKSDHELTSDGKTVMDFITPGGLILGLGFSFGIGG